VLDDGDPVPVRADEDDAGLLLTHGAQPREDGGVGLAEIGHLVEEQDGVAGAGEAVAEGERGRGVGLERGVEEEGEIVGGAEG
jgi:hypothetical protein